MGIKWSTTEQALFAFFKEKGLSDNGIFGLFGNLYAESGMNPKNLQNTSEKRLGYTERKERFYNSWKAPYIKIPPASAGRQWKRPGSWHSQVSPASWCSRSIVPGRSLRSPLRSFRMFR